MRGKAEYKIMLMFCLNLKLKLLIISSWFENVVVFIKLYLFFYSVMKSIVHDSYRKSFSSAWSNSALGCASHGKHDRALEKVTFVTTHTAHEILTISQTDPQYP